MDAYEIRDAEGYVTIFRNQPIIADTSPNLTWDDLAKLDVSVQRMPDQTRPQRTGYRYEPTNEVGVSFDSDGPHLFTGADRKPFSLLDLVLPKFKGIEAGLEPGKGFYIKIKHT